MTDLNVTGLDAHLPPEGKSAADGGAMACPIRADLRRIRELVDRLAAEIDQGANCRLPGNTYFLDDGRVLCRDRQRGDSRYPYGRSGLNFWVHASGRMYGNDGLFFLFLPSQAGEDPSIAFFAGSRRSDDEPFAPLAMLPVPYLVRGESDVIERYTVIGHDATYFITRTGDLLSAVRVFVHQPVGGDTRIVFSTYLENTAGTELQMYASAYLNPFCRHQFGPTSEDPWFKQVRVVDPDGGPAAPPETPSTTRAPFEVAVNEDVSRFRSIANRALIRRALTWGARDACQASGLQYQIDESVCTAQQAYYGSPRRSLASAAFLTEGRFAEDPPLTVFNDHAIVGDLARFVLPAGGSAQFDYVLTFPEDREALQVQAANAVTADGLQEDLLQVRAAGGPARGGLRLTVEGCALDGVADRTLNRFFAYLQKQVAVCAQTNGYMQPSPNSLIGMRDVFQAIEGHLFDDPAGARAKILEALAYVLVDGRCPRQYSLPVNGKSGKADLREFIDQGSWVVSTVYSYLVTTGDADLLDEVVGYHRLAPGRGDDIDVADESDTVLEHLLRIMDYLDRKRDAQTGLLRALYGDWNDALDGLGITKSGGEAFGSGVSVMATLQLFRNCAEIGEILHRHSPGRFLDCRARYERMRSELHDGLRRYAVVKRGGERRIVHGWGDAGSYYVGSFEDCDGHPRDGLTSNAFWVLSGMLDGDPSLRADILAAFHRLDSPYGLKTFAPGFAPDAPGVGRIPKLPLGTAENGAAYIHATLFGIMALLKMGEPREAWNQILKILPFAPHQEGISHSPFVMPNSYVHNPELNLCGQNMNDWQTGSSNVLLKALVWHVFGFQPMFDGLRVAPAAWSPLTAMSLVATAQGRRVRLVVRKTEGAERAFRLNGCLLDDVKTDAAIGATVAFIPYGDLREDAENTIEVVDTEVCL